MRLYVDGQQLDAASSTLEIPNDPPVDDFEDPLPLTIGAHTAGWPEWDGWLDEPAYYHTISASQALRHHRIGRGEPVD